MYSRDEINSGRIDRMDSRARPNERTDLFPYGCGSRLSSDSVPYLVAKYFVVVQQTCTTQTRNAARTSTQRRDRAVTSRRRPGGHCTLARTRVLEPHKSISTPILRSKTKHFRRHGHAPCGNGRDHKLHAPKAFGITPRVVGSDVRNRKSSDHFQLRQGSDSRR